MNVALRRTMSLRQFLAWEERQALRFEFDGFQPVAVTGGTAAHDGIQMNLHAALVSQLRGKPCRPHGSDLKIEVVGRIRYPDAFVVCTPMLPRQTVVTDPVVVFEVLSDGTANTDLVEKNAEYRATVSIQRYVILEQTHAAAIVFVRKGEDRISEIVAGDDAVLRLPEIGIEVRLAEIYADVELTGTPSEDDDTAEASGGDRAGSAPRA
ncbi:MAG TPA: Uma2 family endonuclease [Acetobacteraceae bacterium]|nr:Uma2 family endonuclease [Acetobacteraceae bacterium]